jgi:Inovirus Gp2
MRKNEKNNRLNSDFCEELACQRLYDSSFDTINIQHSKLDTKSYYLRLERFVNEALLNNEIPFLPCVGYNSGKWYTPTSLAINYFDSIPDFIDVVNRLPPKYEYSEPINAFIACCQAMGLLNERLDWKNIWVVDPQTTYPCCGGVAAPEIFNALIQAIRSEWKINNRQAKVNARKQEVIQQTKEYCEYADSLFNDCARLVLVRDDLFYEKQYADSIDVFVMIEDLDRLFGNARHNSLFAFMKGYIVKLEYGVDKGIHAHILFFFDGSERNNSSHINLAEKIGEYWKYMITKGRGAYWNSNANADNYEKLGRLGIGVINWNDDNLRSNLREFVVSYLCKEAQYFRPKWGTKVKLLRRGKSPEIPVNKLGRPRKELESYTGLSQFPPKFMPIKPSDLTS